MSKRVGLRTMQSILGKAAVVIETGWHTEASTVRSTSPPINLTRIFERTSTHHVAKSDMVSAPSQKWSYLAYNDPRSAVAADIDNDGEIEVIINAGGYIICLDKDGLFQWEYQQRGYFPDSYSCPTVADINGDGYLEILVVGLNAAETNAILYCINYDGSERWTFQMDFESDRSCPVVLDVDKDGNMEILVSDVYYVYAVKPDGTQKWSFTDGVFYGWGPIAVADIDGDGNLEIVCPHNWAAISGGVYCLKPDGTEKWGAYIDNKDHTHTALYDIDGDGNMEILTDSDTNLKCLNSNGTLKWQYTAPDSIYYSIAVCDIDADGKGEILFRCSDGKIYCIEHDGTFKWSQDPKYPLWTWRNHAGVFCIDIDNDGDLEALAIFSGTTNSRELVCYSPTGSIEWSYAEIGAGYPIYSFDAVCVEDIDGDGKAEIIVGDTSDYVRCLEGS